MRGLTRSRADSSESATGSVMPPERTDGARRSFVSGRTAILIGIGVINSASQKISEQQSKVDALQQQVDQWQKEDFVRGQARERLHFMLPGEIGYKVIDPGSTENKLAQQAPQTDGPSGPWYDRLWRSMRAAERTDS